MVDDGVLPPPSDEGGAPGEPAAFEGRAEVAAPDGPGQATATEVAAEPAHDPASEPSQSTPIARRRLFESTRVGDGFAFLGVGAFLVAWFAFLTETLHATIKWQVAGELLAATVCLGLALLVRRRQDRLGRGAGLLALAAAIQVYGAAQLAAVALLTIALRSETSPSNVLDGSGNGSFPSVPLSTQLLGTLGPPLALFLVAFVGRVAIRTYSTHVGVLLGWTALASAVASQLSTTLASPDTAAFSDVTGSVLSEYATKTALIQAIVLAVAALGLVVVAEVARRRAGNPRASGLVALTRSWAGILAVYGAAVSTVPISFLSIGGFGDVGGPPSVDPILMTATIELIVGVVLLLLAAVTRAQSYAIPAAVALTIGLAGLAGDFLVGPTGIVPTVLVVGFGLIVAGAVVDLIASRRSRPAPVVVDISS